MEETDKPTLSHAISPPARFSSPRLQAAELDRSFSPHHCAVMAKYYVGNYEGDVSMFRETAKQLADSSDTDDEINRDLELYRAANAKLVEPPIWRLWRYYIGKLLTPQSQQRVGVFAKRCSENVICRRIAQFLVLCCFLLLAGLRLAFDRVRRHTNWNLDVWCMSVRGVTRRVLWWLTLSKYWNVPYFCVIFLITPFIFLTAFFGLLLSACLVIKDGITNAMERLVN